MTEKTPEADGFTPSMAADVTASVEHHAPCVPECQTCNPKDGA